MLVSWTALYIAMSNGNRDIAADRDECAKFSILKVSFYVFHKFCPNPILSTWMFISIQSLNNVI